MHEFDHMQSKEEREQQKMQSNEAVEFVYTYKKSREFLGQGV